jgi:trk system potassium uptake protein TrkH
MILTIIGACGGSTGGGIKFARVGILIKSTSADLKRLLHPRAVVRPKFEGEVIDSRTESTVKTYFLLWIAIVILSTLLLSIDVSTDLFSDLSATLACIGNVGPGFGAVGPTMNFGVYSDPSKILLSIVMLLGRLEIFPLLILFAPRTWKKG